MQQQCNMAKVVLNAEVGRTILDRAQELNGINQKERAKLELLEIIMHLSRKCF